MAERFHTHYFERLEDLLEKSSLQAVLICSENARHKEHVIKAAEYKKHILCEKPLSVEVEDAISMISACREHGVLLQVAYPVRFIPAIEEVRNLVNSGRLGEILAIQATNHGQMPGGWFVEKSLSGGGAATDHIVHVLDLVRWMLKDEVKNVYAELDTRFYSIEVEDCGLVTLELESGVVVSIDPSWSRPKTFPVWGDVTLEITGTEGTVYVDALREHSLLYNDRERKIEQQPWSVNMDERLVHDFIDCVKKEREPLITGEDGLRTLEVVKAAYRSHERKEVVELQRGGI